MARRGAPDGWDPPSVVEITVVTEPRGRAATPPHLLVFVGLMAAIVIGGGVAVVAGAGSGRGASTSRRAPGGSGRVWEPNVVAAVYRPLKCLNLAVSAAWPSEIDRNGSCWRYGVQLTAILREVDGVWRMGLAARSPSCPDVPLPPPVRAQLVVCRR